MITQKRPERLRRFVRRHDVVDVVGSCAARYGVRSHGAGGCRARAKGSGPDRAGWS
jgi:hypothetical protein